MKTVSSSKAASFDPWEWVDGAPDGDDDMMRVDIDGDSAFVSIADGEIEGLMCGGLFIPADMFSRSTIAKWEAQRASELQAERDAAAEDAREGF